MNNNFSTVPLSFPPINLDAHIMDFKPQFDLKLLNHSEVNNADNILPQPQNLPQKLASRIISLSSDYPKIDFLFEIDGIPSISLGDIQALTGHAKSGKSTFIACIITALLSGEYSNFKSLKMDSKVLYIDTEQNPLNTAILVRKVHALCGFPEDIDHSRFHAFNLRGDTPLERCKLTHQACDIFRPDLLIIDGCKDLISGSDINDPKASGETIQFLMTLTRDFNLALLTSLHMNKAKNDRNLRGHIGTELLNKCSECWQIIKSGDIFEAEQTESRNEPVNSCFSFRLNEEKLPVPVDHHPKKSVTDEINKKITGKLKNCLPSGKTLKYIELKIQYAEVASCSLGTAENHIKKASELEFLVKDEKGKYAFNYEKT